jgi:hypothetical protein
MFQFDFSQFMTIMTATLFFLGVIGLILGIIVLFRKVMGEETRVISKQTARLAQKGIAEDVSGLVGNASVLLDSLNQLIKTSSGVGIFLTVLGVILLAAAYFAVQQIR